MRKPSEDLAKRLNRQNLDTQNAYVLDTTYSDGRSWSPSKDGLSLWRNNMVTAVVCQGDTLVGWAQRPIFVTWWLPAQIIAGLLVVALYLFAPRSLWLDRIRIAAAKPPVRLRFERVKAWSWWRCLDPVVLTSDMFDRGNLSKLQILFFALIVAFDFTYLTLRNGALSDLSPHGGAAPGHSGRGDAGQPGRDRDEGQAQRRELGVAGRPRRPADQRSRPRPAALADLVMSGGEMDLYKLQALAFSLIVGFSLFYTGMTSLDTFTVPDRLLEILGLSQVVLVGGQFVKPSTLGDLNKLLDELRVRYGQLRHAAVTGVDLDAEGKPKTTPAVAPITTFEAAAAVTGVPTAVDRYEDIAREVEVLLESMSHRSIDATHLLKPSL